MTKIKKKDSRESWESEVLELVRRDSEHFDPEIADLYRNIENELIKWNTSHDKTAGYITRRIIYMIMERVRDKQ